MMTKTNLKTYKYETHLHTCEGSACGQTHGADYIQAYKDLGYSGIFVTDHFFGGNTAAPHFGEWKDRVEIYCSGYEAALKANDYNKNPDFKVFFGIEQTFDGDDYLVYGLDKAWLLDHPEVEKMNHRELFHAVNRVGGLMIQAHPFRMRDYIQAIHIHVRDIHGIEIYNAGNKTSENEMAALLAKNYDFPVTSGSDIHNVGFLQNGKIPVGGMEFDRPLEDLFDYVKRIKAKEGKILS